MTSPKRRRQKKKKKGKQATPLRPDVDEIDSALKSLSATAQNDSESRAHDNSITGGGLADDSSLLAVEKYHLQVANEMKRVFGRAALAADREEREDHRRSQMQGDRVSLSEAVAGRAAQGGAGLPAVLRRRNIFVQGSEEWPKNTANGLAMEVDRREPNGITFYRFLHTQPYKVSQMAFAQCVATMDPTNMVSMLRYYPYHVATLLQVSEIAKQEKDYATSGELLERALFAFGKAVHPSFERDIGKGKARLDFRRPENREFFLAAWRYIGNIGMRATWRTAFEWARLILALDPDGDPYCIGLMIDQLALRAKQPQSLLDLVNSKGLGSRLGEMASVRYSVSLALRMVDKASSAASKELTLAVQRFPWIAARLFQLLDVAKVPPSIWGKVATTDKDTLRSEIYATLAQDIWKVPDAKAFLVETVGTAPKASSGLEAHDATPITLSEARYVLLTERPQLIGLLPRELTSRVDSMSDPLRPEDSIDEYGIPFADARGAGGSSPRTLLVEDPDAFIQEMFSLQTFLESVVPDFANLTDETVDVALQQAGLSMNEMRHRVQRLMALRQELLAQPGSRLAGAGGEVYMGEDGRAEFRATGGGGGTLFGLDEENAARVEREIEDEMRMLEQEEEE